MEPLWKLAYLLQPASLVLISTAVLVVDSLAHRTLNYEREKEKHHGFTYAAITFDSSQALMIPMHLLQLQQKTMQPDRRSSNMHGYSVAIESPQNARLQTTDTFWILW